jgi:hypothetical protein
MVMTKREEEALIEAYMAVIQTVDADLLESLQTMISEVYQYLLKKHPKVHLSAMQIHEWLIHTNRVIFPVRSESLSQTADSVFDLAREGLPFAMYILHHVRLNGSDANRWILSQALAFVHSYGDWEHFPSMTVRPDIKEKLVQMDGELESEEA